MKLVISTCGQRGQHHRVAPPRFEQPSPYPARDAMLGYSCFQPSQGRLVLSMTTTYAITLILYKSARKTDSTNVPNGPNGDVDRKTKSNASLTTAHQLWERRFPQRAYGAYFGVDLGHPYLFTIDQIPAAFRCTCWGFVGMVGMCCMLLR